MLLFMTCADVMAQQVVALNNVTDCGQVMFQSPATAEFEIRNKSGRAIRVSDVRVGCGCTEVDYPKTDIADGSVFTVKVTYDARTMGHFNKYVDIYTTGSEEPVMLRIKGNVVREVVGYSGAYDYRLGDISADCNDIEFDDVNSGEQPQKKIHILNTTSEPIQPVVMHLPDYLTAEVSPSKILTGRQGVVTLTLDSRKLHNMGLTQTSVYLGAFPGDKVNAKKEISVSAVLLPKFDNLTASQLALAPDIFLSDTDIVLDKSKGKNKLKGELVIRNDGGSTLDIKSLQMFTVGLQVSLNKQSLAPGETAKLKVTADSKLLKTARSKPRILMITNDPDMPKVIINVTLR